MAYYPDYTYLYDLATQTLRIFHCGNAEYTFKPEDVEYLELLVRHGTEIQSLAYDAKSKAYSKSVAKGLKVLMKQGVSKDDVLASLVEKSGDIHYAIDVFKRPDCWDNGYKKLVTFFPSGKQIAFIFSESRHDHKWRVFIQLPWIRDYVCTECDSEKKAMTAFIKFLDANWQTLQNGIALYEVYEEYRQKRMSFYDGESKISITKEEFAAATDAIRADFVESAKRCKDVDFSGFGVRFDVEEALKEVDGWTRNAYRHIFRVLQKPVAAAA